MRRNLLHLLVPLALLVAACGDDEAAAPTTTAIAAPADDAEVEGGDDVEEPEPRSTEATIDTDAPAGDAPLDDASEEGLGDALLVADLDPDAAVPGPGVDGAAGRFESELVDGVLCVDMVVTGLASPVTGAHIHRGAEGEPGPVLVDLGLPSLTDGGVATWAEVCVEVGDPVIEAVASAPEQHHVNVHTELAPDGAVRGQLSVASVFDRSLR